MTNSGENLKEEAENQILRVAIPGSGVVTMSGTEKEGGDESD